MSGDAGGKKKKRKKKPAGANFGVIDGDIQVKSAAVTQEEDEFDEGATHPRSFNFLKSIALRRCTYGHR